MGLVGRTMRNVVVLLLAVLILAGGGYLLFFAGQSTGALPDNSGGDERVSQDEQHRRLVDAKREYREYVDQRDDKQRAVQANLDRPALEQLVAARGLIEDCGQEHNVYGEIQYSQCGTVAGISSEVSIEVSDDSYTLTVNAGGATFTDTYDRVEHDLRCDKPGIGMCQADGHWTLF